VKAVGWKYAAFASKGRISSNKLKEHLEFIECKSYAMIDLSSSSLYDEDLEIIASALIDLNFQADILDLSNNGFGKDTVTVKDEIYVVISSLLDKFAYVDITGCTLSSFDHRRFISKIASQDYKSKLIWIPKSWLEATLWKNCVDGGSDVLEQILQAHHKYYELKRSILA
jgi:hypothetical protein